MLEEIWIKILKKLANVIKPVNLFYQLLINTHPISYQNTDLYVQCTNQDLIFILQKYEKNILNLLNKEKELELVQNLRFTNPVIETRKPQITTNISIKSEKQPLNQFIWNYLNNPAVLQNIELFVSNKQRVLFLIGPKDSGKSFLLQDIDRYCKNQKIKVHFLDLPNFNYLMEKMPKENNGILLIDNIKKISIAKWDLILNLICKYIQIKIIVTCSNKNETKDVLKKLKILKLKLNELYLNPIDDKTIKQILKKRVAFNLIAQNYDQILQFLIDNPKKIDKVIQFLNLFYRQSKTNFVNKKVIDNFLSTLIKKDVNINIDKIVNKFINFFQCTKDDLYSTKRTKNLIIVRATIAFYLRNVCKLNLEEISRILHKHSHSTIINLLNFYNLHLIDNLEIQKILKNFN